jgi:hypothetical protein
MVDHSLRNLPSDVLIGWKWAITYNRSELSDDVASVSIPLLRAFQASTGISLEKGGASRRASVSRLGEEPPQLATGANERSLPMRIAAVTVEADRRRPKKGRLLFRIREIPPDNDTRMNQRSAVEILPERPDQDVAVAAAAL